MSLNIIVNDYFNSGWVATTGLWHWWCGSTHGPNGAGIKLGLAVCYPANAVITSISIPD